MKTILLAEDDKKIALAMTARLRNSGFTVVTAHDAPSALMLARKHSPDLALVDIGLPGGSGFHIAECLRDRVCNYRVPVVFITASKKEGLREEAMKVGANALLEKPFKASELLATIDAALMSVSSWQAPRPA
jgi:DNA-binding response OmpR family regulator